MFGQFCLSLMRSFLLKRQLLLLTKNGERGMAIHELAKKIKLFLDTFFWMMICAGASEQGVSQWASAFAEKGLGVTKTVGDLAGPMAFGVPYGYFKSILRQIWS